jgi:hypothetical protein
MAKEINACIAAASTLGNGVTRLRHRIHFHLHRLAAAVVCGRFARQVNV